MHVTFMLRPRARQHRPRRRHQTGCARARERSTANGKCRADRHAISYGQAQFELEWHKLRNQPAVGRVIAKLTTREQQGQQVAYWDYSTGLDLLYAIKWGPENGLYATKKGRLP